MGNMIQVRAVKKGWYGTIHIDPITGKKHDLHKLYDPGSMKPDQLVFMCREEDFSDVKRTHKVIKIENEDGTVTEKRVKCKPGWMERVEGGRVVHLPEAPKAEVAPVAHAQSGSRKPKKGEEI